MVTVMVVTIKMFFLLTEPFSGLVRIAVMQMAKQAVMQAGDNQSHNSSLGEPPGSREGDGRGWHDLSWLTSWLRGSSLSSQKCLKRFLSNFHNECQSNVKIFRLIWHHW